LATSESRMVRILVVDDSGQNRRCVRKMLKNQADWEVCGEATDGQRAVAQVETLAPDLVVMDIQMPIMNGIDATQQILRIRPHILILILSLHNDREYAHIAKDCGAHGFLAKDDADEHLIPAISALLRGDLYFPSVPAK
jgi:DNA-binding NarL/FixJ family response regulator